MKVTLSCMTKKQFYLNQCATSVVNIFLNFSNRTNLVKIIFLETRVVLVPKNIPFFTPMVKEQQSHKPVTNLLCQQLIRKRIEQKTEKQLNKRYQFYGLDHLVFLLSRFQYCDQVVTSMEEALALS